MIKRMLKNRISTKEEGSVTAKTIFVKRAACSFSKTAVIFVIQSRSHRIFYPYTETAYGALVVV